MLKNDIGEIQEVQVEKKIKKLGNPSLGETVSSLASKNKTAAMTAFINEFRQEEQTPPTFQQTNITIQKPDDLNFTNLTENLLDKGNLSPEISEINESDIIRIINDIIQITTDPLAVASLLKDLDTELGNALQKNNIHFTENDLPQFLIEGKGNFIPGPPPDHYHPKKKEGFLDAILLAHEQNNNINMEGAPKFVGQVSKEKADPLVAKGNVFTEDKQITRLLLHGSASHRLMFYVLSQAAKTGKLNLKYDNDTKELTPQQLLQILIQPKYYLSFQARMLQKNPINLWTLAFDNIGDTKNNNNPADFNFSCRSPFVMNSLLLCFGDKLGLSNLQHYLLDSHWKAAYEMVARVKNAMQPQDVPDSNIYTYCMEALSTIKGHPGVIAGISFPFTLEEGDAQARYKPFSDQDTPNIVKKPSTARDKGEYASLSEFMENKQNPATFFKAPNYSKQEEKQQTKEEVNENANKPK